MSIRTKIEACVMVVVIAVALIIAILAYTQKGQMKWANRFNDTSINQKIQLEFETLEIANTDIQREIGYMNRDSICIKCGMLFVFEQSMPLSFWMKNTRVPLKIIFIDQDGKVTNTEIGQPQVTNPPVVSLRPAKYVLEVPLDSPIDLKPGQMVDIQKLIESGIAHTAATGSLK